MVETYLVKRGALAITATVFLLMAGCTGELGSTAPAGTPIPLAAEAPMAAPADGLSGQAQPTNRLDSPEKAEPATSAAANPSVAPDRAEASVTAAAPTASEMQVKQGASIESASGQSSPAASATAAVVAEAPVSSPTARTTAQIRISGDVKKGTILETTSVEVKDNDTVIDVVRRITKTNKIQMETRGSGKSVYVEGIANLYELDRGGKSGWLYCVNGKFPDVGAGAYKVSKGDKIEWLYTVDMGKDVGKNSDDPSGGN